MDYQKKGIEWMAALMHNEDFKGGILADEMGLGKTSMLPVPSSYFYYSLMHI